MLTAILNFIYSACIGFNFGLWHRDVNAGAFMFLLISLILIEYQSWKDRQ